MAVDIKVPQIGESVTTAIVSRWLVEPGQFVEAGAGLLELDSDKASMEMPSPTAGRLIDQLVSEGDEVDVGSVIGHLDDTATPDAPQAADAPEAKDAPETKDAPTEDARPGKAGPAARQAAAARGVNVADISGTGRRGQVTTADVQRVSPATEAPAAAAARTTTTAAPQPPLPSGADEPRIKRVRMSPLRRTIARRLVEAQQTAAMLTTFNEVDMTAVMALRKRYQERFVARYGLKLGFMSFFTKAVVEALKEFPAVNAELDGDDVIYRYDYHIGVAVSAPKGLVVPVVRHADRLSFAEVEAAIGELGTKAREHKLSPDDFRGGTFTISNGGVFGSLMSTPILNPPQVGILGMHTIQQRPVGVDGQVVLRPMMYLALSYDHRIIDGREAVSFRVRIKELVEAPERLLLEV